MIEKVKRYFKGRKKPADAFRIAGELGLPIRQVNAALEELERAAFIITDNKGRYQSAARAGFIAARAIASRRGAPLARPLEGGPDMHIRARGDMRPMPGDIILVKPESTYRQGLLRCTLIAITRRERVMGKADDVRVQLRSLIYSRGFTLEFPVDAAKQAESVNREVTSDEAGGRPDLRGISLFTIDGDDAKDFDDAISLDEVDGATRLGIHIADVSHYVRRGSPIDLEALDRGTSIYMPGLTLDMLPRSLCNGVCSLMPGADRLALSLFMDIEGGEVKRYELTPSVIRSGARLTYGEVNRFFDGDAGAVQDELRMPLQKMLSISKSLRERRALLGGIEFDLAEPDITLDKKGRPVDVRSRERGEAERMIEDFMLLANETIAKAAHSAGLPFIYRVHLQPDPDKLRGLDAFLTERDSPLLAGENPEPSRLSEIISWAERREDAENIKRMVLRSLRRAEYSSEPMGHYGLAMRHYCHFTAPIRRYPDLETHRMIKTLISSEKPLAEGAIDMRELASQCSRREQDADQIEREADTICKAHYMAGQLGHEYEGVVADVVSWGFYVTLNNTVEGLVPLRSLPGNYELEAGRHMLRCYAGGRSIRVGDKVRVRVEYVNPIEGIINFIMLGKPGKFKRTPGTAS
jgi:ribonuclease R